MSLWTTVTYCATCDAKVRNDATECHKCGTVFGTAQS